MSKRTFRLVSLVLTVVLIFTSISCYIANAGDIPSQGEVAVVGKINVGDVIEVLYDGVRLREAPGLSSTIKRSLSKGEVGVVQDGPQSADGLTWWYVSFPQIDYTSWGWVAEKDTDGTVLIKEKTNNNRPSKPTNQEPSNGATGISLTPTLRASAFSDPDSGDSHLKTWWEIRRVSDDVVVWDSGFCIIRLI